MRRFAIQQNLNDRANITNWTHPAPLQASQLGASSYPFLPIMILRSFYLLSALPSLIAAAAPSSLTIYSQSTSANANDRPQPLLQLSYDATSSTANVTKFTPPSTSSDDETVRVGLLDPSNNKQLKTAVLTSTSSFEDQYQKHLQLFVDDQGAPWGLSFSSYLKASEAVSAREKAKRAKKAAREAKAGAAAKAKKAKANPGAKKGGKSKKTDPAANTAVASDGKDRDAEFLVEVVGRSKGPSPVLNKPIVLNPDGKVEEKEPEKTLFQKSVSPPNSLSSLYYPKLGHEY